MSSPRARSPAIRCACSRIRERSMRQRCRRWRCSSISPRRHSCCRRYARRRMCAFSRRRSRCRSPGTRRWAPRTWCAIYCEAGDDVTLEMKAGVIPVTADGDVWTLSANAPKHRAPAASTVDLAAMLGLSVADLAGTPLVGRYGFRAARSSRSRRSPPSSGRPPPRTDCARTAATDSARWRTYSHAKATASWRASSSSSTGRWSRTRHRVGVRQSRRLAAGHRRAAAAAPHHRPGRSRRPPLPPGVGSDGRPADPGVRPRDRDCAGVRSPCSPRPAVWFSLTKQPVTGC